MLHGKMSVISFLVSSTRYSFQFARVAGRKYLLKKLITIVVSKSFRGICDEEMKFQESMG